MSAEAANLNREQQASQLLDDFELQKDAEFFSDPSNRVAFLDSLATDDFIDITQHVNARMRGYEPREKVTASEEGASLRLLKTPRAEEKPETLRKGFEVIQDYLHGSADTDEEKVKAVGMATEALIVWVHPFNDGNGRTSRFLGKFIEHGTTDMDELITATADRAVRKHTYPEYLRIDNQTDLSNPDVLLDDDEIEVIKKAQEELSPADGIPLSIKRFLEDKTLQARVEAQSEQYQTTLERVREQNAQLLSV